MVNACLTARDIRVMGGKKKTDGRIMGAPPMIFFWRKWAFQKKKTDGRKMGASPIIFLKPTSNNLTSTNCCEQAEKRANSIGTSPMIIFERKWAPQKKKIMGA